MLPFLLDGIRMNKHTAIRWGAALALACVSSATLASAQVFPLRAPLVAQDASSLGGSDVGQDEVNSASAIANRHQALVRLAPKLKIERRATTPEACEKAVTQAYAEGAYQVFVERKGMTPVLAPLAFSVIYRERVDAPRLAPLCAVATSVVVTAFPRDVSNSSEADVSRDYVLALYMANWAQEKADPTPPVGHVIPVDVRSDPFGIFGASMP